MELLKLINEIHDNSSTYTLHDINDNKYKFIVRGEISSNNETGADNMLTITQYKLVSFHQVTLDIEEVVCDERIGWLVPHVNNLAVDTSSPLFPSQLHSMAKMSKNISHISQDNLHDHINNILTAPKDISNSFESEKFILHTRES